MADSIPKVLVICKCPDTGPVWAFSLTQRQFQVALERSPDQALQRWVQEAPDMIVLDSDSRDDAFIDLIRDLRQEADCPILLLTPHRDEDYCLEAYRSGVDECIPKPVSPALFIAKASAWLRQARSIPNTMLGSFSAGKFHLASSERTLVVGEASPLSLTNLEFRLMSVFMSRPGNAIKPDELINRVWGYRGEGNHPLLKNLIYRLRRKIEKDPAAPRHILTTAGGAYMFVKE
jgi:DNA-binding response OmpR family regulator